MRYLLLVLTLFFSLNSFSDNSYTYYKSVTINNSQFCSTQAQTVCDGYPLSGGSGYTIERGACSVSGDLYLSYNVKRNSDGVITYSGKPAVGTVRTYVCGVGEKFQLNGCTPSCVPDPCAGKKGQSFQAYAQCGSLTCDSSATFVGGGGVLSCSSGTAHFAPVPPVLSAKDSCQGDLAPGYVPASPKIPASSKGQSSAEAYCLADFLYNGDSSSDLGVPVLATPVYGAMTPTTEDGTCPAHTVKGQYGDGWWCISDDPSSNQCDPGQIRDNTGTCVPYDQAGTGGDTGGTGGDTGGTGGDTGGSGSGSGSGGTGGTGGSGGSGSGSGGTGGTGGSGGSTGGSGGGGGGSGSGGFAKIGADCVSEPTCGGDPINCSILNQIWRSSCSQMNPISTEEQASVTGAVTGTQTSIDTATAEFKTSLEGLVDTSGLLNTAVPASGGCIPDKQITLMTHVTFTIPFSKICPYFEFLRSLLITIAYLFAARICYAEISGGGVRV